MATTFLSQDPCNLRGPFLTSTMCCEMLVQLAHRTGLPLACMERCMKSVARLIMPHLNTVVCDRFTLVVCSTFA